MSAKPAAGFTLLEVIVALIIAALALVVLFRAGGDGLFAVATASRAEEAVERAQSHLAAIGNNILLAPADLHGDDGAGYRWRLTIKPVARWSLPPENGAPGAMVILYAVAVAITWPGHGHDRAVVLRSERLGIATSAE